MSLTKEDWDDFVEELNDTAPVEYKMFPFGCSLKMKEEWETLLSDFAENHLSKKQEKIGGLPRETK